MQSITIGGNQCYFQDIGTGPALLLLSGWCQDHRLFKLVAGELAKTNRVILMDWRGHDIDRKYDGDFTTIDQVSDIAALVDHLNLDTVIPISTSHGGWANLEFSDQAGSKRVPATVVIDWIMVSPSEDFLAMIDGLQIRENWDRARENFFKSWIEDTDNKDVIEHVNNEMASFDFEMWARSGREIARAYRKWRNPMNRMAAFGETRPVLHIYSQPSDPHYSRAQTDFAGSHTWFKTLKLAGKTHFPTLEQPMNVVEAIRSFVA